MRTDFGLAEGMLPVGLLGEQTTMALVRVVDGQLDAFQVDFEVLIAGDGNCLPAADLGAPREYIPKVGSEVDYVVSGAYEHAEQHVDEFIAAVAQR